MTAQFTATLRMGTQGQINAGILASATVHVWVDGEVLVDLYDWKVRQNKDGSLAAYGATREGKDASGQKKWYGMYRIFPNDDQASTRYRQAQDCVIATYQAQAGQQGQQPQAQAPQQQFAPQAPMPQAPQAAQQTYPSAGGQPQAPQGPPAAPAPPQFAPHQVPGPAQAAPAAPPIPGGVAPTPEAPPQAVPQAPAPAAPAAPAGDAPGAFPYMP